MHTPPQPHMHQPGLLSERLIHRHSAIRMHVPTISFHLGTKERGGGGERGRKMREMMGEIAVVYLYGTSSPRETEQGKKSFLLLRWWIYCPNKKRICIEDPCLIAIEKPKTWWDVNLQRSSLFFSSVWLWEVSKLTLRFLIQLRKR